MTLELDTVRVVVISILTLGVGFAITTRIGMLRRFSIPIAVTGGVVVAAVLTVLRSTTSIEIVWDLRIRDALLLVFFSGVGLSAKLAQLRKGGRVFVRLALLTGVFLVVQNIAGVVAAMLVGRHPAYGLISGSVSLAGGHGTAITWGTIAAEWGYDHVLSHGLAFATFGLIAGGVVGGPLAGWILKSRGIEGASDQESPRDTVGPSQRHRREVLVSSGSVLATLLVFAVCVGLGAEMNRALGSTGLVLPGFVTAMLAGVLVTNLSDAVHLPLHTDIIRLAGDVSLNLFLVMSLISLDLTQLSDAVAPIVLILAVQIVVAVAYARWVVFRGCGGDYDAAVMASGFVGLGLGATPVAMANMEAVTARFGPSPQALLIVPMIGAGVLDLANAFIIEAFLRLLT